MIRHLPFQIRGVRSTEQRTRRNSLLKRRSFAEMGCEIGNKIDSESPYRLLQGEAPFPCNPDFENHRSQTHRAHLYGRKIATHVPSLKPITPAIFPSC